MNKKQFKISKNELIKLYKNNSINNISKIYNICNATIWRTLKEYNIKIRTRSEAIKRLKRFKENNPCWKGGRTKTGGYIRILNKEHPNNTKGYVLEHRLVMEKYLGRYLKSYEKIHHKNGIRDDNRIENLEVVTLKSHYGEIICPFCEKKFLIK